MNIKLTVLLGQSILSRVLCFLFCLSITSSCFAEEVGKAKIIDFGIYSSKACQFSAGLIDANYTLENDGKLLQQTTNIPAKLGTSFGFRYKVEGTPDEEQISVDVFHTHSPAQDPSLKTPQKITEFSDMAWLNTNSITRFCFAENWEIAKGKWEIRVEYEGKKLLSKEFEVK